MKNNDDGVDVKNNLEVSSTFIHRRLITSQIMKLKSENHIIFKNAELYPVPWNENNKYGFLPSNSFLQKYPNDYIISFTKQGCENISAFCIRNVVNKYCLPNTFCKSLLTKSEGVHYCQETCLSGIPIDVYWDEIDNNCKFTDLAKKIFCLKPNPSNQVPPLIWQQNINKCKISEEFCSYYGLTFKDNKCYNPAVQDFFEKYVFGKSLVRILVHPTIVLSHIVDETKEQYSCLSKNALLVEGETAPKDSIFIEGTKQFAYIAAPEAAAVIGNKSFQYLLKFSKTLDPHLRDSILMLEINNIAREYLFSTALKYFSKFAEYATSWYMFFLLLFGDVFDFLDYLKLSKEIDSLQFDQIMKTFEENYNKNLPNKVVTPESVLQLESYKLKSQNKIQESIELLYGGPEKIIEVYNDYFGDDKEKKTYDSSSISNKLINVFEPHLQNIYDKWPIRGVGYLVGITSLVSLSVYCLVSGNETTFILLIIFTILFIGYTVKISNWK